jgi:hypothetical protein
MSTDTNMRKRIATILHQLDAGRDLVKADGSVEFTRQELEAALQAIADLRRQPNESPEQSLARLLVARDIEVAKVARAIEVARVATDNSALTKRAQVEPFVAEANALLDEHVGLMKRSNESVPQAYARLARDREPGFIKLWNHLRSVTDQL